MRAYIIKVLNAPSYWTQGSLLEEALEPMIWFLDFEEASLLLKRFSFEVRSGLVCKNTSKLTELRLCQYVDGRVDDSKLPLHL